ncbi:hypothetical protein KIW84_060819 [Lathyrus oleraceus]|uniref:DUF7745 domain-containing protein n=1 Tax=Pisum sativum TaxID=3888 RepID=A0A9D5A1G5_PEA|nr:hypothetical protein KIW84_060819 [Pisum sativum]
MEMNKRTTLGIKATMPDLQSLKVLQGLMPNSIQRKFTLKYGGILDLVRVPVKVEAVAALAQFYDPPLQCFLFQDFFLDPTLEEFGLYVDTPKNRKGTYMGMGKKVKPKDLAMTLGISPEDLLSHYKEDMDIQGLKRSYLKGVARRLTGAERHLGHPIWERPKEDEIKEFILHGGNDSYIELLRKVTRAWEKVHVKDNKTKRKDTSSEESYTPWIKERVRQVKLPFVIDPTYVPYIPNPIIVSTEEVNCLKATIARLE